jgi:hypothetical protein
LSHASIYFALVILKIGFCFLPRPAWTSILLFYTSYCSGNDRHMPPCPAFLLFIVILLISASQVAIQSWATGILPVNLKRTVLLRYNLHIMKLCILAVQFNGEDHHFAAPNNSWFKQASSTNAKTIEFKIIGEQDIFWS